MIGWRGTEVSLYTRFAAGLVFPLHERVKGHDSVAVRERLERSQWRTRAEIEAEQIERLRAFLIDIGRHVPYWQRVFAERGFDPARVGALADLRALPPMGKAEIRAHTAEMLARDHGPVSRYNTGGSSGEPLVFFIGKARKSHDVAAKWRATRWWGVDIGDPEAVVWGSPIEHSTQDWVRQWRDSLLRSQLLPAFEMSPAKLDAFIAAMQRQRPAMLFGYPSALAHIARHAQQRGVALDSLGVRVAFVTSEVLYDDQRKAIEQAFSCPVANGYGGRDAGFLAHQCPAGQMHLSAEDIVVELLDREGRPVPAGEAGEVVVTHLATRDFPFVRYRTGDVAVFEARPCSCGRGLPALREIQGRSTDFVVAADGTVMHGLALIYVLRDIEAVAGFKIVQESRLHTRVQVVPRAGWSSGMAQRVVEGLQRRLGACVQIDVEVVERIAPEKSGKFRYVVSHA